MAAVAQRPPATGSQSYTFTAAPKSVGAPRTDGGAGRGRGKYREQAGAAALAGGPMNIMWDPRVIRGSTYSAHVLPANAAPDALELQRQAEQRRIRRAARQSRALATAKPSTPPAVDGRLHREIQTELYLEEIVDRVVERDQEVQTDQFLDRPPSPAFVPVQLGTDACTQIEPGELFSFDHEVEPVLEVLVGKTLQQALMEVMQEEEIANMRAHQREFVRIRDAELAETQRLEEAERRRYEEKERRLQQERVRLELEQEVRAKVGARAYAKEFLGDLFGTVFGSLGESGYFFDAVERDVETGFMPWLMGRVQSNLERKATAQKLVDALVGSAVGKRKLVADVHQLFRAQEAERLAREQAEAEAKRVEAEKLRVAQEAAEAAAREAAGDGDVEDASGDDPYSNYGSED